MDAPFFKVAALICATTVAIVLIIAVTVFQVQKVAGVGATIMCTVHVQEVHKGDTLIRAEPYIVNCDRK